MVKDMQCSCGKSSAYGRCGITGRCFGERIPFFLLWLRICSAAAENHLLMEDEALLNDALVKQYHSYYYYID